MITVSLILLWIEFIILSKVYQFSNELERHLPTSIELGVMYT